MNDDDSNLHPWIEPELEARLTALVLGEASDFERDELERLIAERPELALYQKRLEVMHRMLRDLPAGECAEEQGEWKLGVDRRERLLAQLKGSTRMPELKSAAVTKRSPWSISSQFLAVAATIAIIGLMLGLMFPASTGALRSKGGKSQWDDDAYAYDTSGHDRARMMRALDEGWEAPVPAESSAGIEGESRQLALADQVIRRPAPASAPPTPLAEPMVETRSGQSGVLNGTVAIGAGGDIALGIDSNSPTRISVTTSGTSSTIVSEAERHLGRQKSEISPASGPAVAGEPVLEQQVTKLGAGTVSLNGGVGVGDGFIDHKEKTDASASAPIDRTNLNLTGDMQVNGGVEANITIERDSVSLGSEGFIADAGKKEGSEGFGFEAPATTDGLSRAAGVGGAAEQAAGVSRMGRSLAAEKSLSQATKSELKRESADLNTTVFQVPPTFLSTASPGTSVADPFADPVSAGGGPSPAGRVTAKQILESAGISFPEGTTAIYNAETSQLIVRNTADQTELVEAFVESVAGSDEKEGKHLSTRHFLGGAESLRRFDYGDVEQKTEVDKSVQDIAALTPQIGQKEEKIHSASFYDIGEVNNRSITSDADDFSRYYAKSNGEENDGLRLSILGGSPVRLDYAHPIEGKEPFKFRVGATMGGEVTPLSEKPDVLPVLRQPTPATLAETAPEAEPFSTFSLHVSEVSFQLAKAALSAGKWPESEKIRIEEFVNAFDYGDPVPSMEDRVACRIDQAAHPFLQQRNLVRIALRTAEAGRSSGTPLRLTLLLDSSGSMERPDRRATLTRAVATLAGLLGENDRVTLISFARQPRLVADALAGSEATKLAETVAALPSEGGTNLEAALQLAFEKAREHQEPNAQNRIVLLTDGAANLGDAKAESLGQRVELMRDSGIAFDAAGFGADGLNDEILEALTRKGDGRYYLLDRPEDAEDAFAKQIAGALRPAAKNVKVQVEFNPDRVKSYKLLGFEKHRLATEDFRNDAVDAAEMAAAEAGVAVYQVEPIPGGDGDLGSVSVRFRDLDSDEMIERRWALPHVIAPAADQGGDAILLATVASQFAAKLAGGPLGDVVDLGELTRLVANLPDGPRVQELRTMIEQARNLEGLSVGF